MNEDDPKQEDGSGKQGSGEPVVLIHGLGGTTNVWGAQVDDLSRRFTVVRVDLEGSGRSPAASILSVQSWVDDLLALADDEGLSPLRVVGHSLGTLIAQHFTAQNPSRVVRLALLGINRAPVDARRQALRDRAAKVREGGLEAIVDSVVSAGISRHAPQNPLVAPFARELVLRQSPEGYAHSSKRYPRQLRRISRASNVQFCLLPARTIRSVLRASRNRWLPNSVMRKS